MLILLGFLFSAEAQDRPVSDFDEEEGFLIETERQKPEVFITISLNSAGKAYELELRESFIPKILESMKKSPL